MDASSSVSNPPASLDWADDTDDEIDFDAPVFSDDEEYLAAAAATSAESLSSVMNNATNNNNSNNNSSSSSNSNRNTSTIASTLSSDTRNNRKEPSTTRYTAGFTDGSNRSLDRRTQNGSTLQPMSSRLQSRDHQQSYNRDPPRSNHHNNSNNHNNGSYGSPQSEGRWGSRYNDDHSSSQRGSPASQQQRSNTPRTTIPLPPKPAPELDANNHHNRNRMDRSRSPSYRSNSPIRAGNKGGSNDRLPWETSRQRPSSPYTTGRGGNDHPRRSLSPSSAFVNNPDGISTGRSLSPSPRTSRTHMDQASFSPNQHVNNPDGFSTRRSSSPSTRPSRAHMDQVSPAPASNRHVNNPDGFSTRRSESPSTRPSRTYMDQIAPSSGKDWSSNRRSRDSTSEGRWEKTLQEDRPYPNLHPSTSSPRDDSVHFKRREVPRDRTSGGSMYADRLEANPSPRQQHRLSGSNNDRWEKAPMPEQDLPYPEQPRPAAAVGNSGPGKNQHNRTGSRGKLDAIMLSSSPSEKSSPRGSRGKGGKDKDSQKRRSRDQPATEDAEDDHKDDASAATEGAERPWWEQSTYGAKKKTEEQEPIKPAPEKPKAEPSRISNTSNTSRKKEASSTPSAAPPPASKENDDAQPVGEVPWWEQSTYKAKPKGQNSSTTTPSVSGLTAQLAKADLNNSKDEPVLFLAANRQKSAAASSSDLTVDADTLARRKALGQKSSGSGVERMTLVSRGDNSGSSHSLKARHVQEQVFEEIKIMIEQYEEQYGVDKLKPITAKTRQSEEMDTILESFRKLREGLFATETKDAFAVEVYEESVLNSLYAGNIPELTKALHHLVQELHPAVYPSEPFTTDTSTSDSLARIATIPRERKRFLALYILHHLAQPPRAAPATHGGVLDVGMVDALSQAITRPRTETDLLISSMLHGFQQYQRQHYQLRQNPLGSDLLPVLEYWRALRVGHWTERERLVSAEGPLSWDQILMLQHGMGDALKTSRTSTVATISKAYYSLPVGVLAEAVGLSSPPLAAMIKDPGLEDERLTTLKSKFGLAPKVIIREGQIMFKAKS
ncbi:hypothetical protein BGZ83_000754 [Gryganskiella cystojenkinii]|nr:hypothetical protein BGZ83_000754 [Gryganskiella cystojenkinii]